MIDYYKISERNTWLGIKRDELAGELTGGAGFDLTIWNLKMAKLMNKEHRYCTKIQALTEAVIVKIQVNRKSIFALLGNKKVDGSDSNSNNCYIV